MDLDESDTSDLESRRLFVYLRDLIHDLRKPLDVLQEWSPSNFYRTDVIDDINDIGDSSFAQRGDSPPM